MFRTERNFKVQIAILCLTIALGLYLHLSSAEWLIIILVSILVLSLEALNSAVEKFCDFVHIEEHDKIKWIKDVAAGAVLIACIGAVIIGGIIFIPRLIVLFS